MISEDPGWSRPNLKLQESTGPRSRPKATTHGTPLFLIDSKEIESMENLTSQQILPTGQI
jgi:hypothetical protein